MLRLFTPIIVVALAGCGVTHVDPYRPMSQNLPLSYADLAEIKDGSEKHEEVVKNHKFYRNPELEMYVSGIGYRLAAVSERPHLPYRFYILNDDKVDIFSLGGGYIYITRGMLEFVGSEAELAAVLAHEIAHVASGVHTPKVKSLKMTKKQIFMKAMQLGATAAAGAAGGIVGGGAAGNITSKAVDGVQTAMPEIRKYFQKEDELAADRKAVFYLIKANYDPRELGKFLDRVSKINVGDVVRYIDFLNSHPPYFERRAELEKVLGEVNFKDKSFELREERFVSIRMMTMHFDNVKTDSTEKLAQAAPIEAKAVS